MNQPAKLHYSYQVTNISKKEMGFEVLIRVKTQQIIIQEAEDENDLPLRKWMVEIVMLDKDGNEVPADILENCVYYLHKSFENPVQKFTKPPFTISEQGWGEFDMKIVCKLIGKSGKFTIIHYIEFQDNAYAVDYTVQLPLNISKLRSALEKHFTLPNGIDKSQDKKPFNWNGIVTGFDEDMITEFTQIILNDPAVKAEIDRHDKAENVYLYLGQFPDELLEKLKDYAKKIKQGTPVPATANESSDEEIDIFEDKKELQKSTPTNLK